MIIAYFCPSTKVFKTNRKKLTIAVSNDVEQNNENEEVDIEKNWTRHCRDRHPQAKTTRSHRRNCCRFPKEFRHEKICKNDDNLSEFPTSCGCSVSPNYHECFTIRYTGCHKFSCSEIPDNLPYNSPSWKTILLIIFVTLRKWPNLTILKMTNSPQLTQSSFNHDKN